MTNPLHDVGKGGGSKKITPEMLEDAAAEYNRMQHNIDRGIQFHVGRNDKGRAVMLQRNVAAPHSPSNFIKWREDRPRPTETEIIAYCKAVNRIRSMKGTSQ